MLEGNNVERQTNCHLTEKKTKAFSYLNQQNQVVATMLSVVEILPEQALQVQFEPDTQGLPHPNRNHFAPMD
jgi:hypothetical protein